MNTLILMRHGQTAINTRGVLHQVADKAELDQVGVEQARKLARFAHSQEVSKLFASTELRAHQTAQIVAQELGIVTLVDPRIQERNWGQWAGRSWSEIQVLLEPMAFEERYKFIPPEGESWQHFEQRLESALLDIEQSTESVVGLVTHGGALRALMPIIKKEPREASFKYDFANASATIFTYQNGGYSQVIENSTAHLTASE